ncbi:UNVERIFIED_CONTAM: hypothetical protein HHA_454100 [Hammondia hammondi]|eukprot:XP_008887521.1 hypothetical protein HHA_454100 [Hammondia hammondi]
MEASTFSSLCSEGTSRSTSYGILVGSTLAYKIPYRCPFLSWCTLKEEKLQYGAGRLEFRDGVASSKHWALRIVTLVKAENHK